MNKFKQTILNDIRGFVVTGVLEWELSHKQVDELIEKSYESFLENKYTLSFDNFEQSFPKGFSNFFNNFYKKYLFLIIAAYYDARVNGLTISSFNSILAYDNVITPTGPNSVTFETTTDEVLALRKRLEEKWKIK